MKMYEEKYIHKCLQCGEIFYCDTHVVQHKCKQLNLKLKDILDLGEIENIADSIITGKCELIGIINQPKNN